MSDYKRPDGMDDDLLEDIDEEEMYEILQEKKSEFRQKRDRKPNSKPKRPFPKWVFWLIAIFMFVNVSAVTLNYFSFAAIDFIKTSSKLLMDEDVQEYKESVAVIDIGNGRGTGFAFTDEGHIMTNAHVIDQRERLWVYISGEGPYHAEVEETYPEVDLAVIKVDDEEFSHLQLAEQTEFEKQEHFYFIGNPLRFSGIANEGTIIGWTSSSDIDHEILMLEAPVYHGNSGSPVINHDGEVIGVVYATRQSDEHGKVGLAIPIDAFHERYSK
ncbi:S1 family peptidase [Aquisalibacillus elongatus]|uniref:Trypsin-like peptidase n=1 Tax=Aquisalibacillus elongatus TaxID=485577 RepID=A0A3N5AXZ3_9BACI|nr:serine protease [Aquisalibacillus elongatus]RPF50126.1 trypsin-like peptidase [Aquisalibacillus elongatus]